MSKEQIPSERSTQVGIAAPESAQKTEQKHGFETPDATFEVTLDADDDPKQFSLLMKWTVVALVCNGALCATCAAGIVSQKRLLSVVDRYVY